MIKNFIFDFGQVLVRFDPDYMTAVFISVEQDRNLVSSAVFDRLYWDRLDDGSITDGEVKSAFLKRLPSRLHSVACQVYDRWIENLPLIDGMKEIITELKANGKKLYLLSNISKNFAENYKSVPEIAELLSLFDGLVFSGPIGLVKPNKDIFSHLLNIYSLKAEECIFIDDSQKNINGAVALGIKGYLFDGDAKKLKDYISTI